MDIFFYVKIYNFRIPVYKHALTIILHSMFIITINIKLFSNYKQHSQAPFDRVFFTTNGKTFAE